MSADLCPVPEEQQPLNEFKALQTSWFFRWALVPWRSFLPPMVGLWGLGSLVAAPVTAASFPPTKFPLQFGVIASFTALIPLLMVLVQLYLGWRYVCHRLEQDTISYEESGWFDGQLWRKPEDVLVRDRLIVTYQLAPYLHRLEWVFGILVGSMFLGLGSYFTLLA